MYDIEPSLELTRRRDIKKSLETPTTTTSSTNSRYDLEYPPCTDVGPMHH